MMCNSTFLRHVIVFIILSFIGVAVPSFAAASAVYLVRNGVPQVYIVSDSDPEGLNTDVINDFVQIVQRATGAEIGRTPRRGQIPLYIGEAVSFGDKIQAVEPLKKEEFQVTVTPEAIYILGGSPVGTSHGVYTVLRSLGFRWIMPGTIGECLPSTRHLKLTVGEYRDAPAFSYRDIWYAYGSSPEGAHRLAEWLRRNRMYRPRIMHGHNLTSTLERLAPYEQRPDLYALIQGQRKKTQICTSNPEVVDLVAESIKRYMRGNPDVEAYSLCPDDNTDFCECDACRALDVGLIDTSGDPSVADRYQVFLNQVLAKLETDYPNLLVTTYSYNRNHTLPPAKTPVNPRTCIFATSSAFCSAHGIGDLECLSRQDFRQVLERWCALTPHVYIYEYDPVPYSGALPWPMWSAHAREMRCYHEMGVKGVSFEGQHSWAAYFPNYYVAAQFMWDPYQNRQTVMNDMLKSFFGPAAKKMKRYYDSLDKVFVGVEKKVDWGLADYPQYFRAEIVEDCRKALEEAEKVPVPELVKKRIEMVRLSFEEMDAYLQLRRPAPSMTYEAYQAAITRMNGAIDKMAELNEDFILADIAKQKTNVNIANFFAREQGYINEWMICGPFDNLGMDGHDRVYPPELGVDLRAHYVGKNNIDVSWKRNNTPQWMGYVDLVNEFAEKDWVCAYAACWVTVANGPIPVLFRVGSNDSVKVFLNGKEVWNNKVLRGASPDEDTIPVTLPQGTSTVLLKIGQTGANWGFYFRITEPDSLRVPASIRVSCVPPQQ